MIGLLQGEILLLKDKMLVLRGQLVYLALKGVVLVDLLVQHHRDLVYL